MRISDRIRNCRTCVGRRFAESSEEYVRRGEGRCLVGHGENYMRFAFNRWIAVLILAMFSVGGADAEDIKIGLLKTVGGGPIFIAKDKGYFAAEGLNVDYVVFDSAQPVAVAVVAGDIDIGATALTAGFYTLAGQGALRVLAAQSFERPGYQDQAVVASNRAWESGLRSLKDLPGHSVAISQIGGAPHYSLALLAEKSGVDLRSLRILPLQSNANRISAIACGTADTAIIPVTYVMASLQHGEAKFLAWVGDYAPWQLGAEFVSTKATNENADRLTRFLRAYRHGARDYHDAFSGPDDKLQFGPTAPEMIAIIAKATGQPEEDIRLGITYVDAEGRVDIKDILRQIAWYRSQGMIKSEVDGEAIIDKRYAIPLPRP
jgi:NitT/TauT family transport system substrate-binding protein